MNCLLSEKQL